MVLPSSDGLAARPSPKYVDAGVRLLLEEMDSQGAIRRRVVVKIAGGAQMLSVPGLNGRLNVADRNIAAVKEALGQAGVPVSAADVGGNCGRTVQISLDSGQVVVKKTGGKSIEL
jgi:chemotaxis protein CheD